MKKFSKDNTQVKVSGSGIMHYSDLCLHGNEIAHKMENISNGSYKIEISNAGWATNTTKERLNGIPRVCINQKKGIWYLNGKEWDGSWITIS